MERKEISEQIGALNIKILSESKELEKMELAIRKKKIEIRRYKNEIKGLQLQIEEIEVEKWKEKEKTKRQMQSIKKYMEGVNNYYYSQEKKLNSTENSSYIDYMKKNVLPYND